MGRGGRQQAKQAQRAAFCYTEFREKELQDGRIPSVGM